MTAPRASGADREPKNASGSAQNLWSDGPGRAAIRCLQFLIICAAIAFVVWLAASQLIVSLPIMIAVIIACALQPALLGLRARRFGRVGSTATTFTGALLGLAAAFFLIGLAIYHQSGELVGKTIEGAKRLQDLASSWGVPLNAERLEQLQNSLGAGSGGELGKRAVAGFATAGEIGAGLVLTVVLLFFFLLDGDKMWQFVRNFIPPRHRAQADVAAGRGVRVLGRFVRGTTIIALFAAVVDTVVMLIMHAPLAIPLGALIFFGAYIPILGALVTGIMAALVTLVTLGPVPALVLVIVVIIVNQIEHHVLQPKVMGNTLGLHGVVILIALAVGAHTGGIAGALVAVPLSAFCWAIVKAVIDARGGLYEADVPRGETDTADAPESGDCDGSRSTAVETIATPDDATLRPEAGAGPAGGRVTGDQ